jgi:thioredoxin-related protein
MTITTMVVDSKNKKNEVTMIKQTEEDESTALMAAVADGGRSCFTCRVMKKRVDFPRSLRKIQTECLSCLLFRSSGSIETQEEKADPESAAVKYLKESQYQQQHYYHHQPKPHFVLIHGAELV